MIGWFKRRQEQRKEVATPQAEQVHEKAASLFHQDFDNEHKERLTRLLVDMVQQFPEAQPLAEDLQREMQTINWDPRRFLGQLPIHDETAAAKEPDAGMATRTQQLIDPVWADRLSALGWHHFSPSSSCALIWSTEEELNYLTRLCGETRKCIRTKRLDSKCSKQDLAKYFKQLKRAKPHYVYGFPSTLVQLAESYSKWRSGQLQEKQAAALSTIACQYVVTTGETLHPDQRKLLEEAFHCRVINEYSCKDFGSIGIECPAGQLHVAADRFFLEVVDLRSKKSIPFGQRGLLLLTELPFYHGRIGANQRLPRMRYPLGDIASLSTQPCVCGNHLPVIDRLEGREDEIFLSTYGEQIYGSFFYRLMQKLEGFQGFQMIQHTADRLTLKLVKHPQKYTEYDEFKFKESIHNTLGSSVQITVEHVAEIPRTASGKLRYAIREFKLD